MRGYSFIVAAAAAWLVASSGCADGREAPMNNSDSVATLRAHGAGRWFPGSRPELEKAVDRYMSEAKTAEVTGRIVCAIAPHAGYQYSGPVAGYTFRAISDNAASGGKPDAVVILGFGHRASFQGVAVMDAVALETPLGPAKLDRALVAALTSASPLIRPMNTPHAGEHSAENLVPFVQRALPGVPIVVGIMGDHGEATVDALAKAITAAAAGRRLLVVASTDLLHDPDYDLVRETDQHTLKIIASLDTAALAARWSPAKQVCCGVGPLLTVMRVSSAMGCREGKVLHYRNSGDDHPESRGEWVVGYGAVVFASQD